MTYSVEHWKSNPDQKRNSGMVKRLILQPDINCFYEL